MSNLKILKKWVAESKRIVFFGGAGVSTESDIPDFRSIDGLYDYQANLVFHQSLGDVFSQI